MTVVRLWRVCCMVVACWLYVSLMSLVYVFKCYLSTFCTCVVCLLTAVLVQNLTNGRCHLRSELALPHVIVRSTCHAPSFPAHIPTFKFCNNLTSHRAQTNDTATSISDPCGIISNHFHLGPRYCSTSTHETCPERPCNASNVKIVWQRSE